MPFTKITLQLTDEQQINMRAATGDPVVNKFALLAQPFIAPHIKAGTFAVYVLTPEQFRLINIAIEQGYKLPAFQKEQSK